MDPRIDAYFQQHRERHLAELISFLRIPSISAVPAHRSDVVGAAEWVADQLRGVGIRNVVIHETPGHPIVVGSWLEAPNAPTILVYGHYDVQPPDPLEKWVSPPFEPDFREGRLYARGVSDDKGPMFQAIKAAEAWFALTDRLPLNIKFLVEGEEEVSSPNLRPFVEAHGDLLAADLVVSADGAMWRATEPSITIAGRGICGLQVDLQTARTDLHSGRYGGGVPNALHALAELITTLHTPDGRVAVDGFYDQVRTLSAEERSQFAALPFDEEAYRRDLELTALTGEAGFSTLERLWARPTLDVNGMWGGYQGEGKKTVIPCEAHAKITCRLVAEQQPAEILAAVEAHLHRHTPEGARLTVVQHQGGSLPYQMPSDLPALKAAGEVLADVMGARPVFVRMGGTLPAAEVFQTALGAYTLFFSFSAADEQYHAPNEFFRMDRFDAGLRAWATLWQRIANQEAL